MRRVCVCLGSWECVNLEPVWPSLSMDRPSSLRQNMGAGQLHCMVAMSASRSKASTDCQLTVRDLARLWPQWMILFSTSAALDGPMRWLALSKKRSCTLVATIYNNGRFPFDSGNVTVLYHACLLPKFQPLQMKRLCMRTFILQERFMQFLLNRKMIYIYTHTISIIKIIQLCLTLYHNILNDLEKITITTKSFNFIARTS